MGFSWIFQLAMVHKNPWYFGMFLYERLFSLSPPPGIGAPYPHLDI
jgi:hypothetical protein